MNDSIIHESRSMAKRPRFAAAIWTLLLISPLIGELLAGSTRASILFVYVPEVMVWGVGALFCRELVRRWRGGSASLILLGLALSIAEEFIIQQTSLAPLPYPGAYPNYGRTWGVNSVFLLFMLGFESVWIVVVPVNLAELFFARQAKYPWLRIRGTIVASIFFLFGSRIAWYGWTQQARPRLHAAPYQPPATMILLGLLAIAALITSAYLVRGFGLSKPDDGDRMIPAWLCGLVALVMGTAWFAVVSQNFVPHPIHPFWIVIIAAITWAALAFILFVRWSSLPAWNDVHCYAAAFGATLACMAFPYLTIASWPKIDIVGKIMFEALALTGFLLLAKNIGARRRGRSRLPATEAANRESNVSSSATKVDFAGPLDC